MEDLDHFSKDELIETVLKWDKEHSQEKELHSDTTPTEELGGGLVK